jgi:hypothetical protein
MYKNTIVDEEKERIIKETLLKEGAIEALADSMVAPIRCGGMSYGNVVAYIIHGGYPYPERALKATEILGRDWGISVVQRWMTAYREANEQYPELKEPADHWDWVAHKDDADHFPAYSLWDTKRAIRDWLEVEHLPCGNVQICTLEDLCDNCTKRAERKQKLLKAGAIPAEMKP